MKIGILTFHCTQNYGAVLQAYALKEAIKKLGYQVDIIDYRPEFLVERYLVFDKKRIAANSFIKTAINFLKQISLIRRRYVKKRKFMAFYHNALNLSSDFGLFNMDDYLLKYDVFVVGSDQVWNTTITKGFDPMYWGLFKKSNDSKIISYAASMETTSLSECHKKKVTTLLKNFSSISVREELLRDIIAPLSTIPVYRVMDPTFLLSVEDWERIEKKPKFHKKYVLVYHVRWSEDTLKAAHQIASQIDAEVVQLSVGLRALYRKNVFQCASPEEFLGWFSNAACVITTSFHGTAFSIIYRKPFFSLHLDDGRDSRIISLLSELGLMNRLISVKESSFLYSEIDYDHIYPKLNKFQNESFRYLSNAIV